LGFFKIEKNKQPQMRIRKAMGGIRRKSNWGQQTLTGKKKMARARAQGIRRRGFSEKKGKSSKKPYKKTPERVREGKNWARGQKQGNRGKNSNKTQVKK